MPSRVRDDDGAALVEVLMAVVLLGTAVLSILGATFATITVSDVHRKQATAAAVARDYAEKIAGASFVECAGAASYALAPATVPVPSGYTADVASVEHWTGSAWSGTCGSTALQRGLQRITVVASSTDGRATERSVVVVRQQ
jgi:Tfp pilus assembly protein PilV